MTTELEKYIGLIKEYVYGNYQGMFRDAGGAFAHPFLTPGSEQYADVLWDWDSWTSNVAVRQILLDRGDEAERERARAYERGCVKNFLAYGGMNGWIPTVIGRDAPGRDAMMAARNGGRIYGMNMHKPCLAQHAAFLTKQDGGDAEWLREDEGFYFLQCFVDAYFDHYRHRVTGLHFWADDKGGGVDNDPTSFYRPPKSCASIYLNTLMLKEYEAIIYLAKQLGFVEIAGNFERDREKLAAAVREHLWDPRDGFYYSGDLNLLPYEEPEHPRDRHPGGPRRYDSLIMRIGVWSGFMPMWAGFATAEEAARIVAENYHDERTYKAPFGVRTLSRQEKMYDVRASGNPSSWLGPIWGISNYMVFRGLVKYGFDDEARELAEKTIRLFGRDIERTGAMHEYYEPETGEPILNRGFQNWNMLVINMIGWLEGREVVEEF